MSWTTILNIDFRGNVGWKRKQWEEMVRENERREGENV